MSIKAGAHAERNIVVSELSFAWMRLAASVCFGAGALLHITSLVLSLIGFLDGSFRRTSGAALLVAAFVLFALGAHFLDCFEAEELKKREW